MGGFYHPNACRARTLHGLANRGCALILGPSPEAQILKVETLKQDQQKEQQGYTNSDAEALSGLREKAAAIAKRMQVQGVGFRVWVSGFGVQGLGLRLRSPREMVSGLSGLRGKAAAITKCMASRGSYFRCRC